MIGDRYSLEREIGRGGMGAVWLGRDEVLGRPVAIKRVGGMPGVSTPDLDRAEREARIAASLNHPNVVAVFDLVDDDEQQWLVMEHVPGTTLSAMIGDRGPIPVRELAPILAQAAQALAAAHAAGIVHRDVKPSNILVRDDGEVKISDFGIARAMADAALTQTGLVTGSPAYLAPEIAAGRQATAASDVWSLGATMFHALSGRPPYDVGDNVLGALYRIVNEPPPRLERAGALRPVLEVTLTHEPADRLAMEDVAAYLGAFSASGDAPAGPAPSVTAGATPTGTGSEPEDTQRLATVPSQAPAPPAPPVPEPGPPPRERAPRGRALPVVIGFLVVALLVVIGLLVLADDPQPNLDADPGSSASSTPSAPSSTEDPTQEPTEDQPPAPDAGAMEQFARDYVSTASADPSAGFAQLTPSYQDASPGYQGFWGRVSDPEIDDISADPEALTVTYTYSYRFDGGGERSENVTLQLVQDGDGFRIDGAT